MGKQAVVDGVPAGLIFEAVRRLDFVSGPTSEEQLTGPLTGDSGEAFVRAHSHFEAELLFADQLVSWGHADLVRTEQERRFDAMIAMLMEATS